ncbi:MAG: 3-oxoadipate enol-lactonase [Hyphomicrobiaceae bacterium]|jgi:3-oxoadipate enol-lactonase
MKRIEANGISFMTTMVGSGPRLLYISGTGGDLRQPNAGINLPLAETYEMLAYDQRGLGQTDKPPGPYTMAGYAADAAAVMDAYGWDRAHIVGYSFGGMVAQEIAIRSPERVNKLVLGATAAGGPGGSSFGLHTIQSLPPRERALRAMEVSDLSFTPEWQAANPKQAEERITARVAQVTRFADEPGHRDGEIAQLEGRSHHDTYDRLDQITAPTLVLSGSRDGQAPKTAGEAMSKRIPDCRFEVHEGSHAMIQENPNVCRSIAAFFSGT